VIRVAHDRDSAFRESLSLNVRKQYWFWLVAGAALSLWVSYAVATRSLVLGDATGHWVYRYLYRFNVRSLVVSTGVSALCGAVLSIPTRVARRHDVLMIALWLAVGFVSQYELRRLTPYTLERVFESDGANGFYTVTQQYSSRVFLREFDRLHPGFPVHPRSNMPGKTLFVYALERISNQPSILVWLVIGVSNVASVLMYLCARELTGDKETALYALILSLFVPGRLFFFPVPNTITPVWVLMCLYLWLRSLRSGDPKLAVLLGLAVFWLMLYEPLPLVTAVLLFAIAGHRFHVRALTPATLLRVVIVSATAFAASYVCCRAWLGFDLFATFHALLVDATRFNAAAHRSYAVWVRENLFDVAFAMGMCQTVLLVVTLGYSLREWVLDRGLRTSTAAFSIGLAASLLITNFLGINRGEVVRLWIFVACLAQLPAAVVCARLNSRVALLIVLATTLLHDALATSMFAFAQP
jgi:hypothetical protein